MTDGQLGASSPQRTFYAEDPSDYFRDRLSLLALRAGAAPALAGLAADGVTWGPIRLGGASRDDCAAEDLEVTAAFVVTESQVLLRQASVALVIHFLAHADRNADPWVEAPRLSQSNDWVFRLPGLAAELPHDAQLDAVAEVFLGDVRPHPQQTWLEARDVCARLLGIVARRLVAEESSAAYAGLGLPAVPVDLAGATAAAHDRAWLTHLTINQLRVLWKVARKRHLGQAHDGLDLVTAAALGALASS